MIFRTVFFMALAAPALADGPRFSFKDSLVQQEFENVYHDLKYPAISNGTATTFTITGSTITSLHVGSLTGFSVPAASGKLKQVVSSRTTSSTAVTSTSYTDTALSATITPTAATSSILVLANGMMSISADGENALGTVFRDATNLATGALQAFCTHLVSGGTLIRATCSVNYLDAPATTSALTYKVRIKRGGGAGTATWGDANDSNLTLIEIGT